MAYGSWKRVNWKGDIVISKNVYDILNNNKIEGLTLKGKNFLGRSFKWNGYSHHIIGYEND